MNNEDDNLSVEDICVYISVCVFSYYQSFLNDFKFTFFPLLWTGGSTGTAAGADTNTGAGGAAAPADKRHGRHQKHDGNSNQQDVVRDKEGATIRCIVADVCLESHKLQIRHWIPEELFH